MQLQQEKTPALVCAVCRTIQSLSEHLPDDTGLMLAKSLLPTLLRTIASGDASCAEASQKCVVQLIEGRLPSKPLSYVLKCIQVCARCRYCSLLIEISRVKGWTNMARSIDVKIRWHFL
jgi:hypothetical protein